MVLASSNECVDTLEVIHVELIKEITLYLLNNASMQHGVTKRFSSFILQLYLSQSNFY